MGRSVDWTADTPTGGTSSRALVSLVLPTPSDVLPSNSIRENAAGY